VLLTGTPAFRRSAVAGGSVTVAGTLVGRGPIQALERIEQALASAALSPAPGGTRRPAGP
jgi:hypothetical protein